MAMFPFIGTKDFQLRGQHSCASKLIHSLPELRKTMAKCEVKIEEFPSLEIKGITVHNDHYSYSDMSKMRLNMDITGHKRPCSGVPETTNNQYGLHLPRSKTDLSDIVRHSKRQVKFAKDHKLKSSKVEKVKSKSTGEKRTNHLALPEVQKEICRISFPCFTGCVNCAFTTCLGPVRVYFSQLKEEQTAVLRDICDGYGRYCIVASRRHEFRGLVYNKETFSLCPPNPKDVGYLTRRPKVFV